MKNTRALTPARFVFGVIASTLLQANITQASEPPFTPQHRPALSSNVLFDEKSPPQLEERVGQLLILGFPGISQSDPSLSHFLRHVRRGWVGGVLLLERNIVSLAQLHALTKAIQAQSPVYPAFISIDQEGGHVQRLGIDAGATAVPDAHTVAAHNPAKASDLYLRLAADLVSVGVNFNFAPVVDLALNDRSNIITGFRRSFSRRAEVVVHFAEIFIQAHRAVNILTCLKHFPGHGSTAVDSHERLPDISKVWRDNELLPYEALVEKGAADAIMVGHLLHPRFSDEASVPSSLSTKTMQFLRKTLDFDGLILVDDLHMRAIVERFGEEEAAIRALNAGADLLLFSSFHEYDPTLVLRLHSAIRTAILDGALSEHRVNDAFRRVARYKRRLIR